MSYGLQCRVFCVAMVLVSPVSGVTFAGETHEAELVAEVGPAVISWQANVEHAGADVTVQGPDGQAVNRSFDKREPLVLELSEELGAPLADGSYSWEIRLRPVLSVQAQQELDDASGTQRREAVRRSLIERGELPAEPVIASSSFRVQGGVIWNPSGGGQAAIEERQDARGREVAFKDQVIVEDLIVQSSICVGFDCVNGEGFGFDTFRLKENNLRIHFDDTSISGSFPSNDWRITANDSTNGGGSYLSIDDATAGRQVFRVDAGAPANSLRVDSAGDVGIGTSNPVVELHVTDGDTPTLRLEQDGSSGFAPQTWDVAGNEANFFIRDVTNGSQLAFRIEPGADESSIHIEADNDVGMGTSEPDSSLHVRRTNGTAKIHVQEASATTAARTLLHVDNNGAAGMMISDTSAAVDWLVENDGGQLTFSGPGDRAQQVYSPAGVFQLLFRGSEVFRVDRLGNLTIAGTLSQGGTRSTSADSEVRAELESLRRTNQRLEQKLSEVLDAKRALEDRVLQLERLVLDGER